jgi:minor histocompatibility antigen H13
MTYNGVPDAFQGCIFPKTYFYASLTGYIVGMLFTLGVMQVYGQAQPALLYLVPGTLGALWGTALFKGDIKAMWEYTEAEEEEEEKSDGKDEEKAFEWYEWTKSWFIGGSVTKVPQPKVDDQTSNGRPTGQRNLTNVKTKEEESYKTKRSFARDGKSELISFSVELPRRVMKEASEEDEEDEDDEAVAHRTRSKAAKSKTEGDDTPEKHVAKRTRARTKHKESRSSTDLGETW